MKKLDRLAPNLSTLRPISDLHLAIVAGGSTDPVDPGPGKPGG